MEGCTDNPYSALLSFLPSASLEEEEKGDGGGWVVEGKEGELEKRRRLERVEKWKSAARAVGEEG